MEKNGNKSAMGNAAQQIECAEKANEYKAHRLSIAPMMDCPVVVGKSHKVKSLRA